MTTRVLIVDDEDDLCVLLKENLERLGYACDICFSVRQAKAKLERFEFDVVLTDLNMGAEYGMELVSHIVEKYSHIPVIVMSAFGNEDVSVMALKLGAFDFINKPLDNNDLDQMISRAVMVGLPDSSSNDAALDALVGESEPIKALKSRVKRIARGQAPVFIHGESGSGKEVVASVIHKLSTRSNGPYVVINCGAIPADLIESELFGHKKGSFTGASHEKIGLIQLAHGGSLFLDEVAELPLNMQVKLLRAVQEKKIRPVGSDSEISVDFRLISATHRNIEQMVKQGTFRQDLFFRLHVMDVLVPPLRDRGFDIVMLAEHFVQSICAEWGLGVKKISPDVRKWLVVQSFPGNVRELNNLMQRAITLSETDYVTLSDCEADQQASVEVKINISSEACPQSPSDAGSMAFDLGPLLAHGLNSGLIDRLTGGHSIKDVNVEPPLYIPTEEGLEEYISSVEKKILESVLESVHYNTTVAAKILKLDPRAMRYRVKKFGLKEQ